MLMHLRRGFFILQKIWWIKISVVRLYSNLKTTMTMESKTLWVVSHISAFLGQGVDTTSNGMYLWSTETGEILLNEEEGRIEFIDSTLDMKTYFAIVGLANSHGLTTGDYFTKK